MFSPKEQFLPSRLSNLTVWLDAQATSTITVSQATGGITSWSDRSSNGNTMNTTTIGDGGGSIVFTEQSGGLPKPTLFTRIASSSDGTKLIASTNAQGVYISTDSGVTWTRTSLSTTINWSAVGCSPDGTTLVAGQNGLTGVLFVSINSGLTWTSKTPTGSWRSFAFSSDGVKIVATSVAASGNIWTSTNSGNSWTQRAPLTGSWNFVASDSTATKLVAILGQQIYTSTNSGGNWTLQNLAPANNSWTCIVSDSTGTKLVAVSQTSTGTIWRSINSGIDWVQLTSGLPGGTVWRYITSSADGTKLAASGLGGIYTSTDSGDNWTQQTSGLPTTTGWTSITSSADGTKLAANNSIGVYTSTNLGVDWAPSGGFPALLQAWSSITSSSNGRKLAAVIRGGGIYTSSNSGSTWIQQTLGLPTTANWLSITSSADGTKLAAVVSGGGIYTSIDSGVTWVNQGLAPTGTNFTPITCSSNWEKLATTVYGGGIYISSDFGSNWIQKTSGLPTTAAWTSITSSADGTKLAAVVSSGGIYTSTNSGDNWSQETLGLPTTANWGSITSSADGTKLAAVVSGGGIYTRANSGITWIQQSSGLPTNAIWVSITSSADGTKLAAAERNGGIYTSSTSGITWIQQSSGVPTFANWSSITYSANGTTLAAVVSGGGIYTAYNPLTPVISNTTIGQPSVYFPAGAQMTSLYPLVFVPAHLTVTTVTTTGTYTFPTTAYTGNVTVIFAVTGGGGGGGEGYGNAGSDFAGGGGGQGGTTEVSVTVTAGTTITYSVSIGAGGSGGTVPGPDVNGNNGSNSILTLGGNTYIGGGGEGGKSGWYGPISLSGGVGGSGTTVGYAGGSTLQRNPGRAGLGGGGAGGVKIYTNAGGGGGGGGGPGGGNGGDASMRNPGDSKTNYATDGSNAVINSGAGGGGGGGAAIGYGGPVIAKGGAGGDGKLTITVTGLAPGPNIPTIAPKSFIAVYQCPTSASAINLGIGSNISGGAFGICQSNNTLYAPYQYAIGDLSYSVTNYTGMNYAFISFNSSTNILTGIPGFNDLSSAAVAYQNNAFNTPYYIGSPSSSTLYTSGGFHLCEFIATSNALSSTDRENVEGYLAWKWGISGQLPSDHPYALFPPSGEQWISTVTPANICGLASWMDATFPGQLPTIVDRVSGSFSYSTASPTLSTIRGIPYFNIPANISKNITSPTIGSALVVFSPQSNGTVLGWGGTSPNLILTSLTTASYGTTTYTLTSAPQMMFIGWGDGNYYSSLNGGALTITANSFVSATTLTIGQKAGEVVMYNDFLEQPSRQILEGYLARKWNIIGNLPTTHPYYSTAPTLDTLKDVGALSIPTLFPTLTMWLDAADTSFTGTQWFDKSPIGDVFRANGTNPLPVFSTISASGPSIPGVYFNGTASMLGTVPTGMANGIGTTFLVCSSGSMTVLAGGFTNGTQVVNSEQSFGFQSNLGQSCCPIQGLSSIGNNSTALSGPGPNVYFASMSNGTGSAIINFQKSPGTTWQPSAFTSTTWCLGYIPSYPIQQKFYLHEFVTFSTQLSTQQQQVMEGYLGWKWGIQSMLPAGHPYKSARPYNP